MPEQTDRLAEIQDRADVPWHVEECSDEHMENCPCIIAARLDGRVVYVADGETPELAARIVADHNEVAQLRAERDRYHGAWHNARDRAASSQADADKAEAERDELLKKYEPHLTEDDHPGPCWYPHSPRCTCETEAAS